MEPWERTWMKPFEPLDVARILRALDEAEYASTLREHAIDIISAENHARAYMLSESGSRAWFVLNPEDHEFSYSGSPRVNETTVVTYGPTRGLLGDLVYEFSERLRESTFERVLKDFLDYLRRRAGRP